jgi:hypothetical protein
LYEGFLNAIDGDITLDLGRGNAQSQKIQLGLLLKENRGRVFNVPLNDKDDVKVQLQLAGKKKRSQVWTLTPVEEKPKKTKTTPLTRRTDPTPEEDPDRFPLNPS